MKISKEQLIAGIVLVVLIGIALASYSGLLQNKIKLSPDSSGSGECPTGNSCVEYDMIDGVCTLVTDRGEGDDCTQENGDEGMCTGHDDDELPPEDYNTCVPKQCKRCDCMQTFSATIFENYAYDSAFGAFELAPGSWELSYSWHNDYDFDCSDGDVPLTMEFLPSESNTQVLMNRQTSCSDAEEVDNALCDGSGDVPGASKSCECTVWGLDESGEGMIPYTTLISTGFPSSLSCSLLDTETVMTVQPEGTSEPTISEASMTCIDEE